MESQIWDITWIKNLTLLDKTSILPESYYKDFDDRAEAPLGDLWGQQHSLQHRPSASYMQDLTSPPHLNSRDLQLPHLQGLESCLEGNAVEGLVSARLGMRLESSVLFLCNKLGTAKHLRRTAGSSPDKAKTPQQGKSTAQRFSQTTLLRKPTQHAAEKPTLSGYSAKRA